MLPSLSAHFDSDRTTLRPVRTAALIAGVYCVVAAIYILLSSQLASEHSGTVAELRRIEILKGLAFVAGSTLLLFLLNATALNRAHRKELEARRLERALSNAEPSVIAGTFARTIAHDINNGLAAARLSVEMLGEETRDQPAAQQLCTDAAEALEKVREWNHRFFSLGERALRECAVPLDLAAVIQNAARLAQRHHELTRATVTMELPETAPYVGIESLIQRAVLNLVLNAAEASGPQARVHVALVAHGTGWRLTVEDDGAGVPPHLRSTILEPFFTTRPTGTGLGLASVVACARFHDGAVTVDESRWGGARFVVALAAVSAPSESTGT